MIQLQRLSNWQEEMIEEVFSRLSADLYKTLKKHVHFIQGDYEEEKTGDGHYHTDQKLVTIGYSPHPRYFIELVGHEALGHGLEEELMKLRLYPSLDENGKLSWYAFGTNLDNHSLLNFPTLAMFYPRKLEELVRLHPACRQMRVAMNALGQFPPIDLDKLVKRYAKVAEKKVKDVLLSRIYRSQRTGYLSLYWKL